MSGIATAVRWRHGTFVLFCLLAVFGGIALSSLPLELQPGGDRPEITITTRYPGASPVEVENLYVRVEQNFAIAQQATAHGDALKKSVFIALLTGFLVDAS